MAVPSRFRPVPPIEGPRFRFDRLGRSAQMGKGILKPFFKDLCFQIASISGLEILFVGTPKVSQQQQQKQQQRQWRSGHHSNRANMTSKQHIMNGADKRRSVLARAFRSHLGAGRRGAQCWPKAASEMLKSQKKPSRNVPSLCGNKNSPQIPPKIPPKIPPSNFPCVCLSACSCLHACLLLPAFPMPACFLHACMLLRACLPAPTCLLLPPCMPAPACLLPVACIVAMAFNISIADFD